MVLRDVHYHCFNIVAMEGVQFLHRRYNDREINNKIKLYIPGVWQKSINVLGNWSIKPAGRM